MKRVIKAIPGLALEALKTVLIERLADKGIDEVVTACVNAIIDLISVTLMANTLNQSGRKGVRALPTPHNEYVVEAFRRCSECQEGNKDE